jgi:hypothetical protein
MEGRGIDGFPEWLLPVSRESNDGLGPGARVIRIARQIAPHDRAGLVGNLPWKGPVDPDKSVANELPYLCVA